MRDYKLEFENRVAFIKDVLYKSGAEGIVYGNSGGKDSALTGILCKAACSNTAGIILPCNISRNYNGDMSDAKEVAEKYGIETRIMDLQDVKDTAVSALESITRLNKSAVMNLTPRLRMAALYAVAASENRLVAGTGNRSEAYTGYFTKWGDGACDFNPVADLTVTEIYEFLRFLDAPECILTKKPSAALADGQTDEEEMGISYAELDAYITGEDISPDKQMIAEHLHSISEHKRKPIITFCLPERRENIEKCPGMP